VRSAVAEVSAIEYLRELHWGLATGFAVGERMRKEIE
jgi:hypothetical protein